MSVFKALMLPPLSLLLLGLLGLWIARKSFRLGASLAATALGLLYVMSTGLFGAWALGLLSPAYVDPRTRSDAQAIVVLAGGTYGFAPEYEGDTVSGLTLMRVRYAARLHRLTDTPVLVSGGTTIDTSTEAEQMRALLAEEFKVPVRWVESRSRDTFENALESRQILAPLHIKTIYLVTHAWHVPRARLVFEHAGFTVVAAPTGFAAVKNIGYRDFLPQPSGLVSSYYFFHEIIGYVWYWIRIRL